MTDNRSRPAHRRTSSGRPTPSPLTATDIANQDVTASDVTATSATSARTTRSTATRSFVDRFSRQPLAAKVPEITALFWVIKIATTAGGEATSDFLAHHVLVGGATEVLLVAVGLWVQFHTRRYAAPAYWFLAFAIACSGTGVSDTMHLHFGIPYAGTTCLWAVVLAGIFWHWHRSEGTLSIHSIVTRRRETYYWATVFATFALGTALGDFTANALGLGYLASTISFGVIILIPLVAWRFFRLNEVPAFWFAYVVTRPLGASFADYLCRAPNVSGIGFGDGPTSLLSIVIIVILVAYVTVTGHGIQSPESADRLVGVRGQYR
jgi:uncharacterized membrane-anchored protein